MKKFSLLNESNKHSLTKELLEDYLTNIEDSGIKFDIFYVYNDDSNDDMRYWEDWSYYSGSSGIHVMAYHILFKYSKSLQKIENISQFNIFRKLLDDIYSFANRISSYYHSDIEFDIGEHNVQLYIKIEPTIVDACRISYDIFDSYFGDMKKIKYGIKDTEFVENEYGGDIIFNVDKSKIKNIDDFHEIIEKIITSEEYTSIDEKGDNYIIHNLICVDDIKFKY